MRVLVTGGGGYIGSVMTELLLNEGFDVTVLDRFFFGQDTLRHVKDRIRIIKDDIRWFDPKIMEGHDAVIDMAAMSNDPVGELDPNTTMEINYKGRVRVAAAAKKYKVKKYILASSISIYGFKPEPVDETSPGNPLTTYSKANYLCETEVFPMADKDFCVTALRQSSVYGLSNRMRFDISVNAMVLDLFKTGMVKIGRDGKQKRPFIHIKDTSNAFITALKADEDKINGQLFNVGSNDQNFELFDLAEKITKHMGLEFKYEWIGTPDFRSYSVKFDKIERVLGYKCKYTLKDGVEEIYKALKDGTLKDDDKTITLKWYKKLAEMKGLVDEVVINNKLL